MGSKYSNYQDRMAQSRRERHKIHPVWRGVGFALMVLIPIISYAATEVLLDMNGKNNWFPLPVDLLAGRGDFLYSTFPDPLLYIKILMIVSISAVLFGLVTWISFLVTGLFGATERNDPYYVPPMTRRPRRRL